MKIAVSPAKGRTIPCLSDALSRMRAEVVPTLVPLLEQFKAERQHDESFGDYCHRQGVEKLQALLPKDEETKETDAAPPKPADGDIVLAASGTVLAGVGPKGEG